jgi:hypothetical protein
VLAAPAAGAQLADDLSHANAFQHYRDGEALLHAEQFAAAMPKESS